MQKWETVDAVYNRYLITSTTSGSTNDIYITDGEHTIMLEDCLIWDESIFEDAEADAILAHLQAVGGTGVEEYEGWHLIAD